MANYNREILVPYLRDVCSAELLCEKLLRECGEYEKNINWAKEMLARKPYKISPPVMKDFSGGGMEGLGYFFLGVVLLGVGAMLGIGGIIILGIPGAIVLFAGSSASSEATERKEKAYADARRAYSEKAEYNRKLEEDTPGWTKWLRENEQEHARLSSQLEAAETLRQQLYDVNIIPGHYRDARTACYLYTYFNTCRETDLDKVIQTLLLDDIKQRLNKIILQNEEVILNQRYQMALEERQLDQINENHQEQMKRIAQMEQNQELQIDYQNMITKNQMVTNFFLASDYFEKH